MHTKLRRLAIVAVVCGTAFGVTSGVAGATKPARGCPPAFDLVPVNAETPAGVDKNGDGWACIQVIPPFDNPAPGDNWIDNTSNH
jgi:hypothetical protein